MTRKLMTGRELLNSLQTLSEETLSLPTMIGGSEGGYASISHISVIPAGFAVIHMAPEPSEEEKNAALKKEDDRLWAGSVSEDGLVVPVEPTDLKRAWAMLYGVGAQVEGPGMLSSSMYGKTAVWFRLSMLQTLLQTALFLPWVHDGKLDDAVFNVAAKFPIKRMPVGAQRGLPFDVQEFVRQLQACA